MRFPIWSAHGLHGRADQEFRKTLGYGVLAFLLVLFVLAYALKKNYWKDIH